MRLKELGLQNAPKIELEMDSMVEKEKFIEAMDKAKKEQLRLGLIREEDLIEEDFSDYDGGDEDALKMELETSDTYERRELEYLEELKKFKEEGYESFDDQGTKEKA